MLTHRLIAECPPSLRAPLARYLAGEVSGEITLMHFALQFGKASLLRSLLATLACAASERKELADRLRRYSRPRHIRDRDRSRSMEIVAARCDGARYRLRHRAHRARFGAAGRHNYRHRRLARHDPGGATAVPRSGECRLRAVQRA
jgi:hypothetical protein